MVIFQLFNPWTKSYGVTIILNEIALGEILCSAILFLSILQNIKYLGVIFWGVVIRSEKVHNQCH